MPRSTALVVKVVLFVAIGSGFAGCGFAESPPQFADGLAVLDERRGAAVEIVDRDLRRVDAEVVVDRRQEIAGPAGALSPAPH